MHNFTPEDLIQYLYNETSPQQTVVSSAKERLEVIKMGPRQQTIDNILNYAEKAVSELTA